MRMHTQGSRLARFFSLNAYSCYCLRFMDLASKPSAIYMVYLAAAMNMINRAGVL